MKPALILQQYSWIVNTLLQFGGLTLNELDEKWRLDKIADGNPLPRSTFNRYRDAIQNMFGIIIECHERTYKYYISNPEVMNGDSIGRWLINTMSVHGVLADSTAISDQLILENVPVGEHLLPIIIRAIKKRMRLRMGYQKFGAEGYEKVVCPYGLKLFHQRWYMLALNDEDQLRIYALDRVTKLERTTKPFRMPKGFSVKAYFSEYFGVLTNDTPMAHVVIRAHKWAPAYLRTLPLHHSQRELQSTPDYTDFAFDLRPTSDFLAQILSQGAGLEVLEPAYLREKMRQSIAESLKRYED